MKTSFGDYWNFRFFLHFFLMLVIFFLWANEHVFSKTNNRNIIEQKIRLFTSIHARNEYHYKIKVIKNFSEGGITWNFKTSQMGAVIKIGKPAIPRLIPLLDHRDYGVRAAANSALFYITGKSACDFYSIIGESTSDEEKRKVCLREWRAWWASNKHKSPAEKPMPSVTPGSERP